MLSSLPDTLTAPAAELLRSPVTYAVLGMAWLTRRLRRGTLSAWFFGLPGVVAHESAHWLMAWATGARPASFRPWPHRLDKGRWALGSVQVAQLSAFNAVPVGLAPLLLLVGGAWGWWTLVQRDVGPLEPVFWWGSYLVALAAADAWPSGADWRLAASSVPGLLLWSVLVVGAVYGGLM
ncbi:hypothetical protein SAMN05660831_00041 [Thiohalospira halophila DSM 15071]|uniref:Peptidase M50B-like n=1 Tax=Thiohalospira halophila DSM 15071 TaxID=1123397 RepID=A0A1I1N5I1_9GAMM|nr:hypothetical protein [Thiohalospira halophila]SFC90758.1 hypothetical protein SAMN05660831_00041 [Thiohalospira halophila DSM 15071]